MDLGLGIGTWELGLGLGLGLDYFPITCHWIDISGEKSYHPKLNSLAKDPRMMRISGIREC